MPKSAADSPTLAPGRKHDRDVQSPHEAQIVVAFDDNGAASALVGPYGQNLALIERRLGVVADSRGNHITVAGSRDGCDAARRVLEMLYEQATRSQDVAQGDVEGAIRAVIAQGSLFEFDPKAAKSQFEEINPAQAPGTRPHRRAGFLHPRAEAPRACFRYRSRRQPARPGLRWRRPVSCSSARKSTASSCHVRRLRAGERLGFLPGDMREKVDPYLRPIYDALYDLMDSRVVERGLQSGEIEIAPLAFMRGRTLANAAIILDEAQNTTSMQMKMFLTRLGENSRMIITGDPSQVDLPNGQPSGLAEAAKLLDGVEGIAQVKFTAQDVIRHELVARIVAAYEGTPKQNGAGKP